MIYNKEPHSRDGVLMQNLKIVDGTATVSNEIKTECFKAIGNGDESFLCGESNYKIKFVADGDENTTFLSEAKMFFLVKKEGDGGEYVVYL